MYDTPPPPTIVEAVTELINVYIRDSYNVRARLHVTNPSLTRGLEALAWDAGDSPVDAAWVRRQIEREQ